MKETDHHECTTAIIGSSKLIANESHGPCSDTFHSESSNTLVLVSHVALED